MTRLISFKAGQCFRQGDTNTVVPSPGRGLITIEEEDGLLHFRYEDVEANAVTEDLILFPGDASFIKAADRVHCLKFSSSSARSFYWHQDVDSSKDDENARRVNELIGGQADEPSTAMDVEGGVEPASSSTSSQPTSAPSSARENAPPPSSSNPAAASSSGASQPAALGSAAQMAQLESIMAGLRQQGSRSSNRQGLTLPDLLPPSLMQELAAAPASALTERVLPLLPSDLPQTPYSAQRALTSNQFSRSLASLDRALRTGALGPLVTSLGLPPSAAEGVDAFLDAVQKQADEEKAKEEAADGTDRMNTD